MKFANNAKINHVMLSLLIYFTLGNTLNLVLKKMLEHVLKIQPLKEFQD